MRFPAGTATVEPSMRQILAVYILHASLQRRLFSILRGLPSIIGWSHVPRRLAAMQAAHGTPPRLAPRALHSPQTMILLDGRHLTLADLVAIADDGAAVGLDPAARTHRGRARDCRSRG
jgi:hypothetical protein